MLDLSRSRSAPPAQLPSSTAEVAISAVPAISRFSYRGSDGIAAVRSAFGVELPTRPGGSAISGDHAALWLGPDEWLLLAPEGETVAAQQSLTDALADIPHALVDISHRQVGLRLEGSGAARLLNAGVPLDLSLAVFPVGMVTRTIFEKAEIVLWRTNAESFRIEVWRSFAPYLFALLEAAQRG